MESALNKRNYSLDLARIIAALAVVMIHCSANFILGYHPFIKEFIIGNIFDSVSRIGVPLFLMISGALFLDEHKDITLKGILCKNVKSLAVITVIWAVIYSIVNNVILMSNQPTTAKSILDGIVYGHFHMWYLYMIIGLYIITPFLRKFVCKKNKGLVLFFIMISFLVQFLAPFLDKIALQYADVDYIGVFINKFHLGFFGGYITYFLAGWYLVHIGIKQKWHRCIIYFLGAVALGTMFLYVHFTGDYKSVYDEISATAFVYAVSVFLAFTNIKINIGEKTAKVLTILSKLTFGVYIIHAMVLQIYIKLFPYENNPLLYIVVCFVIVLSISVVATFIISKIPVIKKLIRS